MNRIFIISFLLICGCTVPNAQESTDQFENKPDPQTELTLDDLKLMDLNGVGVPGSALKGKAVFVNLWATWCRPCVKEMPAIQKAKEALAESQAEMIFIFPSNEAVSKIRNFKKTHEYNFDYYHLNNDFEQLGIYILPTTFIFNKEGKLIETVVGAKEWDQEDAIEYLREIAR